MPQYQEFYFTLFSILTLFVIPKPLNGFSLQLIHRDSLESPFYLPNLTSSQRITRLVNSSYIRANSNSDTNPQRLRFELDHNDITFLVKLSFGSPYIHLYLIPDTGSHLVWTQCEPCSHKFHQLPPIYNSTASHTYLKLPCEHPFCKNNFFKCRHGECVYRQEYGYGAITEGIAASDVFQPYNNNQMQIYFGCSKNSQKFESFAHTGMFGGIMGLSMSPISFLQQLANITHHRFSYCLTPYGSERNSSSLLRFGDDVNTRGRRFKSIPIVSPPNIYKYYLNLQDISVAGHRLNFHPNTFALKRDGSGGFLVDSGTLVTHIIQPAYIEVLRVFKNYFDSQGLERVHSPQFNFDLCYKHGQTFPKFASMTFHFEGGDFEVEPQYMYLRENNRYIFCVALLHEQDVTILGAMQQANTRFIFDAAARQILFSPENCMNDR